MALYDDSLETSVTSAKLHNSPYKVDFMRKLVTFSTGTFLSRKKFHGNSRVCKKIALFSAVSGQHNSRKQIAAD
ncbi:unnamed protein product [Lasius platythorax]|uniref:Uncharacterized protein n=1 Tax=Lasius platythorax TaxID=488582 RepID=A0AAV2NMM6_9HYME